MNQNRRCMGGSCSCNVLMSYRICSTTVEKVYLTVGFLHGLDPIAYELHFETKRTHTVLRMTDKDLLHVACNTSTNTITSNESRNAAAVSMSCGACLVIDDPEPLEVITVKFSTYENLKNLCSYIIEDIDIMKPYVTKEEQDVKELHALRRLFFAYIRDLHERASTDYTNKQCANDTLQSATLQGFRTFLVRCGLIFTDNYDIKTIIGDEDEMVSDMVKDDIPPTARLFIHYIRCENYSSYHLP